MKHIFTLIILLLHIHFASSQITITEEDIGEIGSSFPRIIDTQPTILPGGAGEDLTWDFSSLVTSEKDTVSFIEVNGTPYASEFPNAELCIRLGADIDYAYATISETEINILGGSQYVPQLEDDVVAHFEPSQKNMIFPATFGTSFNDNSGSEVVRYYGETVTLPGIPLPVFVDSVKVINTTTSAHNFDAWGELITPYGDFSTIRSWRVDYLDNQLFALSNSIGFWVDVTSWMGNDQRDTISTYSWWAKNIGYPVFEITTDYNTGAVKKAKCLEVEDIAVNKVVQTKIETSIYPVPADDDITLSSNYKGKAELKAFDMTGSLILSEKINSFPSKIDVSSLSEGLYFYTISGQAKETIGQGKFTIVH